MLSFRIKRKVVDTGWFLHENNITSWPCDIDNSILRCVEVGFTDSGRSCKFPFSKDGFEYTSCTFHNVGVAWYQPFGTKDSEFCAEVDCEAGQSPRNTVTAVHQQAGWTGKQHCMGETIHMLIWLLQISLTSLDYFTINVQWYKLIIRLRVARVYQLNESGPLA